MIYLLGANVSLRQEYAVGVGWVLPVVRDCDVCGDLAATRIQPHPLLCTDHPLLRSTSARQP